MEDKIKVVIKQIQEIRMTERKSYTDYLLFIMNLLKQYEPNEYMTDELCRQKVEEALFSMKQRIIIERL